MVDVCVFATGQLKAVEWELERVRRDLSTVNKRSSFRSFLNYRLEYLLTQKLRFESMIEAHDCKCRDE